MKVCISVVLFVLLTATSSLSLGNTFEVGVRGGTSTPSQDREYFAGEVYGLYPLPWKKTFNSGVKLLSRLDVGLGHLDTDSHTGTWLAFGADVVLRLMDDALEIEGGFRPAWLLKYDDIADNLGGPVQFSSHVGISFNLGQAALNYRFQHLSNAGLYTNNSGIDLHLFGLGLRF